MVIEGGDAFLWADAALAEFAKAGVNADSLAAQLQDAGARSFVKSWNDLMDVIQSKCDTLKGPALKAGG